VVALFAVGALVVAGPSSAATLTCPNFTDTDIPAPPAGTTGYLFIGTSISTSSSSITVMYTGGQQTVAGDQQGGGAFHYVVYIPQGATVTSATVTGATADTVVTVSGCLNGPPATTTTTAGPPTPGGTTVTPGAQVSPSAAARPVSGVTPRTTG
jgi:hypothetical protein